MRARPSEPIVGTVGEIDREDRSEADLTIVGLSLKPEDGLLVVGQLRETDPDHPVLVLLLPKTRRAGEQAIEEGANGYLLLNQNGLDLAETCETALNGRIYRPPPSNGDNDEAERGAGEERGPAAGSG